jgi:hypothetical protein
MDGFGTPPIAVGAKNRGMGDALERADKVLIQAFTRLSHFVDWRFHINQFDLARTVMGAGLALLGAQSVQDVIRNWRGHTPVVVSVSIAFGLVAFIFSVDLARLARAGEQYESHPHRVSREAAHYFLMPFFLRLMLLVLGSTVAGMLTVIDLTTRHAAFSYYIENFWLMLVGCSWYIAGGIPPYRGRKKKKAPHLAKRQAAALQGASLLIGVLLAGCSAADTGSPRFAAACRPFDPDVTQSCVISSERWSEIAELPEPPALYRYCAWPGLLSGAYRTRYRDLDGSVHDFTEAPAETPSFLLKALKGADNSPATEVVVYRMTLRTKPCPNTPPP